MILIRRTAAITVAGLLALGISAGVATAAPAPPGEDTAQVAVVHGIPDQPVDAEPWPPVAPRSSRSTASATSGWT